ncbi:hypothetical protein ACFV2Q_16930 [Streptomyces sp. NPDC059650]|uniref:effector-associated constant component EACC1 n=1 Tax=Streptomyces sp. NPDC059650 TaxID=3346896 RepID=UPI00367CA979
MRVDLHVQGDQAALRSLYKWLSRDPDLRRTARIELTGQSPQPGDMGDVLDLVTLVIGSGWSAASLGVAVAAWRGTRPNPPAVTIRRGDLEIVLTGADEEQMRRAVAVLDRGGAGSGEAAQAVEPGGAGEPGGSPESGGAAGAGQGA